MIRLPDRYGPFRLAFLEAVLRASRHAGVAAAASEPDRRETNSMKLESVEAVVSISTLIRMKEAAGRPEDKIDVEYLRMRLEDYEGT
ncbi:MAG: hypothetical protein HY650_03895 [Acidobacteria bacterium]|nr:hypothetical protein [Acidobacteriota bacterium]